MDGTVIDFGIINYNGGRKLIECVSSILGMQGIDVNIFVYDNASTDSSLEMLSKHNFPVTVIASQRNSGYAYGCNQLLQVMDRAEIVVLCNMDVVFDARWGEEILKAFTQFPQYKSLASLVLHSSDPGLINSCGVGLYKDLYAKNLEKAESVPKAYQEVFGCYGAVMCLKKEVIDTVGNFDADYFLFYEETDFYWRMNLHGFTTLLCPQALVYHYRSLSTVRYSPRKLYYAERNRIWTCFKILPLWYLVVVYPLAVYRLYAMARGGLPARAGDGTRVRKSTLALTVCKAWADAHCKVLREMGKRRLLWRKLPCSPRQTLKILARYQVPVQSLNP
ncbi:glycosyltransferase family 2 protein [Desulfogranum japonicum]|uniref:glycosyltransferase family 2 protein n=1 Tax=Desulfogranum japonicum TaxID=231447 RepID=UPI00041E7C8A|nr:glycosyltransferase family 2 protein [Desulfogranum japonicum]